MIEGKVWSFTQVFHPPEGFEDQVPYFLALVKLDAGPMVLAQLTDLHFEEVETDQGKTRVYPEVEIGLRVESVTRKLRTDGEEGMIIYGYKFRPVLGQNPPTAD